jgi:hypothetical protein
MAVAALKLNGRGRRVGIRLLIPDGAEGLQVVSVVETKCRIVDPSRASIVTRRFTKPGHAQQLAQHPGFALGGRPIWRRSAMYRELRVLLERRMAFHAMVVRPLRRSLQAAVLRVTDCTVGNSFRQGEWIVIALTLMMTVLAVFVVDRTDAVVDVREPHERLPGRAMTVLAIGLREFVTRGDRPRQKDRMFALEREYRDEHQRHNPTRERKPSPVSMQAIGHSLEMQVESFGY